MIITYYVLELTNGKYYVGQQQMLPKGSIYIVLGWELNGLNYTNQFNRSLFKKLKSQMPGKQ